MSTLTVEMNADFARANTELRSPEGATISITPPLDEDYWLARVPLHPEQAIVCFPKFFTVGCGFQHEEDWNTNLPLSCDAKKIFSHIEHNKKYAEIKDEDCIAAIELLQKTVLPMIEKKKAAHSTSQSPNVASGQAQ